MGVRSCFLPETAEPGSKREMDKQKGRAARLCLFFQMKSGLHDFPNLLTPAGRARPGPMSGTSRAANEETHISRPTDQYTGTME